jgi:1-aminocyclopropane-1-carboxylate deaminase
MGMNLRFVSRKEFDELDEKQIAVMLDLPESEITYVPSGGYHTIGASGASIMYDLIKNESPTHILMAMGTGTTMAGFMMANPHNVELIGVSVLKGMEDWDERFQYLLKTNFCKMPVIWDNYHCGGYAKYDDSLIAMMNDLYNTYDIKTDFVYTGKMMTAVFQELKNGYFKPGSKIICVHTGGLQGNLSLTPGLLSF